MRVMIVIVCVLLLLLQDQLLLFVLGLHTNRLLFLPDEHIMDHGSPTKDDSHADQNTCHDGWRWVELGKCVEDYTCKEGSFSLNYSLSMVLSNYK